MKKAKFAGILTISTLVLSLGLFMAPGITLGQTGCVSLNRSLSVGSRDNSSKDVSALQNFLYSKGYLSIPATGYFGQMTFVAVKNFQGREGLPVVGIVGPMTRARINTLSCITTLPPIQTPTPVPIPTPLPNTPAETPTSKVKQLPYALSDFSDLKNVWGATNVTADKTLEIRAGTTTNGAQVILSDSNEWTNYKILANVFVKQATLTLISRYTDDNNFVACTFSGRYIEIVERTAGNSKVVAQATIEYFPNSTFFYNDLNLSMRVKDKTVGCSLIGNEDNVSYNNLDSRLGKGGVGIQIWVNTTNVANIELRGLKVDSI